MYLRECYNVKSELPITLEYKVYSTARAEQNKLTEMKFVTLKWNVHLNS